MDLATMPAVRGVLVAEELATGGAAQDGYRARRIAVLAERPRSPRSCHVTRPRTIRGNRSMINFIVGALIRRICPQPLLLVVGAVVYKRQWALLVVGAVLYQRRCTLLGDLGGQTLCTGSGLGTRGDLYALCRLPREGGHIARTRPRTGLGTGVALVTCIQGAFGLLRLAHHSGRHENGQEAGEETRER